MSCPCSGAMDTTKGGESNELDEKPDTFSSDPGRTQVGVATADISENSLLDSNTGAGAIAVLGLSFLSMDIEEHGVWFIINRLLECRPCASGPVASWAEAVWVEAAVSLRVGEDENSRVKRLIRMMVGTTNILLEEGSRPLSLCTLDEAGEE